MFSIIFIACVSVFFLAICVCVCSVCFRGMTRSTRCLTQWMNEWMNESKPGVNNTFKNLANKTQAGNCSVWTQVASIEIGLLQQWTNDGWLMRSWKLPLLQQCIAHRCNDWDDKITKLLDKTCRHLFSPRATVFNKIVVVIVNCNFFCATVYAA